ncbi:hypothetical protein [Dyadobacter sp.]|uniref:hypothetical protein n=1 Tax=Dyadobacter sp. TaxID=1914288 RepID=UPI003F71F124
MASQGILSKYPGNFNDPNGTMRRFYPNDDWIDQHTEFLFDFGKVACWPTQATPQQSDVIRNLVTGKPNFLVNRTTVSDIAFREGGIFLPGQTSNYLTATNAADFRLNATLENPDFVIIYWIKRETGFTTNNYQAFLSRGSSSATADQYEIIMRTGTGGLGFEARISNGVTGSSRSLAGDVVDTYLNKTAQLAMAVENGNLITFFNGVEVARTAFAKPYNAAIPGEGKMWIGAGAGGASLKALVKRFGLTKLIPGGKSAAQRVLDDFNWNKARLNPA